MDRRTFPPAPKCSTQWGCPSAPSHQSLNPFCPPALPHGSPGGGGRRGRISSSLLALARRGTPRCWSRPRAPARRWRASCRPWSNWPTPRPAPLKGRGLHTLYISPLKALATDVARNLEAPIADMGLPLRVETRTGDTPAHKRARQMERPPDILHDHARAARPAAGPSRRRGALRRAAARGARRAAFAGHVQARRPAVARAARLRRLAPGLSSVGLSATVREPDDLQALPRAAGSAERDGVLPMAELVTVRRAARRRDIDILERAAACRWPGTSRSTRWATSTTPSQAHRPRSSSSTRACRPSSCSRSSGASTRTAFPSRCITARSTSASGARWRRR